MGFHAGNRLRAYVEGGGGGEDNEVLRLTDDAYKGVEEEEDPKYTQSVIANKHSLLPSFLKLG